MIDRQSETWLAVQRLIGVRLEKLRDDLEQSGMAPEEIRGELAALRWVLAQGEPVTPIETFTVDYMQAHDPS